MRFFRPLRSASGSIRLRLQTTSLLAVLAGYLLLLLANRELGQQRLLQRHSRTMAAVGEDIARLPDSPVARAGLPASLAAFSAPERLVWLESSGQAGGRILPIGAPFRPLLQTPGLLEVAAGIGQRSGQPTLFHFRGRTYLTSSLQLFVAGPLQRLRLLEEIEDEVALERQINLLLVAIAGSTALFTSFLLRLVIRRGLEPLDAFGASLGRVTSSSLRQERLPVLAQPSELRPIARSFNNLLDRMAESWEHQRTFVNAVSHELRTPITLIHGYAARLLRRSEDLPEAQREQIALVHTEAARMGRLVSDLLEIAREDAGRLEVRREPTDAWQALAEVYERLAPQLSGRLRLDGQSSLALEVLGDGDRLQQCLTNLIENAIKYSPPGSPIELAASSQGDQVVLHVRDCGPGVPQADRRRIFQRFVRGTAATDQPGSGIGLAVVATLMERMGGTVQVQDAEGGGADFQLLLESMAAVARRQVA